MNFCLGPFARSAKARVGLGQLKSEGSKWKLKSEGSGGSKWRLEAKATNKNEMKSKWRPEAKANKNQKTQRQKSRIHKFN
jgi:hypothetical protein